MANNVAPVELMNRVFSVEVADTKFNETPAVDLLAENARLQSRRNISWTADLLDPTVTGRTVAGALSNDTQVSPVAASLEIADYYMKHQFEVLKRDIEEASDIGEVDAIRDILGAYARGAFRIMGLKANNAIINGTGALDNTSYGVIGLETVIEAANYASIPRATYPRWRCIEQNGAVAGTPEALTVDRVTDLLMARRAAGATHKAFSNLVILTHPNIHEKVLRNLYDQDANPQGTYNGIANISDYTSFFVQGIPVLSDYDYQPNSMHFVDLSKIVIKAFDMRSRLDRPDIISYVNYKGLQFRLAEVEVGLHPDKYKFEMATNFQLQVKDPLQAISALRDVAHTVS